MNKITFRNFFIMLLACLLIVIMMLVQLSDFDDKVPLTFTLGLIVIVAACVFILYETIAISNQFYKTKSALDKLSKELADLKAKQEVETVVPEA